MNNAGIWLVVRPTVGLPLFIGGVCVTALVVHTAVLTNTTWYPAYLNGGHHHAQVSETTPAPALPAPPAKVAAN
jgi:light-harvesting protein B-800-850 alpha chain